MSKLCASSRMTKTVKYGLGIILVLAILTLLAVGMFLSSFNILGDPERKIILQECDYEGLRRVNLFKLSGNSTANPSIHITVGDCGNNNSLMDREIFTADKPHLIDSEVKIIWISFDTLKVEYADDLRVFNQKKDIAYSDSTLDLHIVYSLKK